MVLQTVTVGHVATEEVERLQAANEYSEAYYFHGLAVQAAEATANYLTHIVQGQLGIPANRGKRYSWGYPPAPSWPITRSSCACCRSWRAIWACP